MSRVFIPELQDFPWEEDRIRAFIAGLPEVSFTLAYAAEQENRHDEGGSTTMAGKTAVGKKPTKKKVSKITKDARRYATLVNKRRRLEDESKVLKKEIDALEEALSELFIEEGVGSIRVGGATVHIAEEFWPELIVPEGMTKDEAKSEVVKTLVDMGRESMIGYNHMSMRSLVKELMESHDGEVPEPLGTFIQPHTDHRVRVRGMVKGGGK